MSATIGPAIAIEGLKKDYGSGRGVFGVSFAVERGEVFGFLGPNGAGKTVTMRNLMGFIRPDEGTVSINGLNCFSQRARIQEHLGYLPGEIACMDEMTGAAFLEFMARMKKLRDRTRMEQLIEYFELDPARRIRKMSKGTKQKVGLVCAFMTSPDIVLLDEPTSGLDPVVRSEMLDLFLEFIQDEEHSILLSSHITSDLEKVADYITFIHAGKIVFSKTKDDILEQYGVVKCEKARAAALDGAHILGRRDSKFDAELLVDNRPEVARLYPGILTEQATIDDIMTFFAKGAYDA